MAGLVRLQIRQAALPVEILKAGRELTRVRVAELTITSTDRPPCLSRITSLGYSAAGVGPTHITMTVCQLGA